MGAETVRQSFGIGQPAQRVEDARFLTGRGRYVDDIHLHGEAHAVVILSPHAHARIKGIDSAAAKAAPGVLCVLTGADAAAEGLGALMPNFMPEDVGGPKGLRTPRPILVPEIARCVGDRVAIVVAETLAQARDAAELVNVDYEPLPAVSRVEDAVKPGAPNVYDDCPGNVNFTLAMGDEAATDAAFKQAAHVVALRLENNRLSPSAIEPRVALGDYNRALDSYTLYTSSQAPHAVRSQVAGFVFHLPETKFRVVAPDVGGGFGLKADAYPEDALVLWASRVCGRPVRWVATRSDAMLGDNHARDQVAEAEMAFDADGKVLAMRVKAIQAFGAYVVSAAVAPIMYTLQYTPGVYDIKILHVANSAVFTNTTPQNVYRGAGRPEGNYIVERLMDRAAHDLGLAPDEIRRRNMIKPADIPYTTQTGCIYDSGEFEALMDDCMKLANWDGYEARHKASAANGKVRGRGLAYFIEHAGIFNDTMTIRFDPSGNVTILAGTHSHGQGHETAFAQLVSEFLGVPFEAIRYIQGDTDSVPFGRGTYAARSALIGGVALKFAADAIIEKGKLMAAHFLEVAEDDLEFENGEYRVKGTDKAITMTETATHFFHPVGHPPGIPLGLEASGTYNGDIPSYPNGCQVCEVELDPDTGEVRIDRYTVVDDCGKPINPLIVEGQVQGGLAQGIGQALLEHVVYDADDGQLLTGSFLDYAMPRSTDMGTLQTAFHNVPSTTNPLGIKGVGESGTIGAPPTVINAVMDALRQLGVEHIDMPATPHRVWQAIQKATPS